MWQQPDGSTLPTAPLRWGGRQGHSPGTAFAVTAPSSSPFALRCRSQRRDTARPAPRPVSRARRPLSGLRACSCRARGGRAAGRGPGRGPAQRRAAGAASSRRATTSTPPALRKWERGAGPCAAPRRAPPASPRSPLPRRPGLASPPPPLTCVPDDDVFEEIRVGHGRPVPGSRWLLPSPLPPPPLSALALRRGGNG